MRCLETGGDGNSSGLCASFVFVPWAALVLAGAALNLNRCSFRQQPSLLCPRPHKRPVVEAHFFSAVENAQHQIAVRHLKSRSVVHAFQLVADLQREHGLETEFDVFFPRVVEVRRQISRRPLHKGARFGKDNGDGGHPVLFGVRKPAKLPDKLPRSNGREVLPSSVGHRGFAFGEQKHCLRRRFSGGAPDSPLATVGPHGAGTKKVPHLHFREGAVGETGFPETRFVVGEFDVFAALRKNLRDEVAVDAHKEKVELYCDTDWRRSEVIEHNH
mmetsp:Transcript_11517/g.22875  ORF Transcript_11517/g.22875 Transcript_11517/m.22875 type:complete len:273 (+) Transcript_11517:186-1004(+)